MEPDQEEQLRNTEELNVEESGKQEGRRPSGSSCHPWTDSEIRIFLEEWEVVERRVGNPGRKISETIQALCLQLNERRGLKKSWESCVDLLLTLQNLHRSLCSGRPEAVPLFSPYSEALYRILGRPPGSSCSPWTDSEIRIFLQEWEGVEWRVGNPCRKILEKSWAIHQQINERRGLKKSWESCVDLLLTLQNLHRILCNERLEAIPLFSPYSKALYRILGQPPEECKSDMFQVDQNIEQIMVQSLLPRWVWYMPACQELSTFRESAFKLWYHCFFYTASGEPIVYEVFEEFRFPEGTP
ncbi:uncharacterized protein LOC121456370 [Microtus oregoni]|uniref:uncharacterized protein LOC121456370 n=1 Tax=Microtus oregoni TaxID=111838 RepID=UPI001BB2C8C5|nr:uncharacterized protein LOC121456370 [Microtus oregoni]